ncbi:hypothetical protein EZV62_008258 [Acer yangbiense]|uniref:Reverse transcriptase Ty1/copia-type domain-containing protein n=1 Tax=Acer yangbiense TaxID=1000413 RepID=A0A5C7ICD5_9ROSI|nr:hypothetical protein EZV62_008258 [Acer yangbiense]
MQRNGLYRCNADHYCYFKKVKSSFIILLLYVDDMLVAGANLEEINDLKKQFSSEFKINDLGVAKQILGIRISRDEQMGILQLSQAEYVCKVLQRFIISDTKPVRISLASHFRIGEIIRGDKGFVKAALAKTLVGNFSVKTGNWWLYVKVGVVVHMAEVDACNVALCRHGAGFWGGYDHASSVRYGGGGVGLLHCLGRLAWATAVIDLGRRNLIVSRLAWGPEWKGKP